MAKLSMIFQVRLQNDQSNFSLVFSTVSLLPKYPHSSKQFPPQSKPFPLPFIHSFSHFLFSFIHSFFHFLLTFIYSFIHFLFWFIHSFIHFLFSVIHCFIHFFFRFLHILLQSFNLFLCFVHMFSHLHLLHGCRAAPLNTSTCSGVSELLLS